MMDVIISQLRNTLRNLLMAPLQPERAFCPGNKSNPREAALEGGNAEEDADLRPAEERVGIQEPGGLCPWGCKSWTQLSD